jgi:CNT family concentrative nucleoside transporter
MPTSWRVGIGLSVLALAGLAYALQESIGLRGQALVGVFCFLGLVATFSVNLRAVNWRTIGWGFALQLFLGIFVIQFEVFGVKPGYLVFQAVVSVVAKLLEFTNAGSQFVFGPLADPAKSGFVFAFAALPTVIFVASFFTVLYYFGTLPFLVRLMARAMKYLLGTSGAETLSVSANVFMGQTEAPLIVKPYVARMTQSELLTLMVGGMAHISGALMAVYIGMKADPVAILATSVMAAPCSLYLSKLFLPELSQPETLGEVKTVVEQQHANVIDAASAGASDGMRLALNIAAMLIAFLAFIAMFNFILGHLHIWIQKVLSLFFMAGTFVLGVEPENVAEIGDSLGSLWFNFMLWDIPLDLPLSLEKIFAWAFAPVAFLMGADPADIPRVAELLGTKLVANEFVAYGQFQHYVELNQLSDRSRILLTYALTGFANFASIGIQLGGIGAIAPSRRADLARLGGKALFVGFLATLINASIAGMLMSP